MILQINNFDLIALAVISLSTIWGIYKGVTKSVLWLIGIFSSIYSIINYRFIVIGKLANYIDNELGQTIVATIIIIVFFMASSAIIAKFIKLAINAIGLVIADHLIGGIFGAVRGYLVLIILAKIISINDQALSAMETNTSRAWPIVTKLNFLPQTANLSSLKTYLHS